MSDDNQNRPQDRAPHAAGPEEHEFNRDNEFDDFDGGTERRNTVGDLWRNNPAAKVGMLVGGAILLIGAILLFSGRTPQVPRSEVSTGSSIKATPGTDQVSDQMAKALTENNTQIAENAEKTGGSAIPVPINPPKNPVALEDQTANQEDPLARWRRIQDERTKREQLQIPQQQQQQDSSAAIKALAEAMAKQMESILKNVKPLPPQYKVITAQKEWDSEQKAKADAAAKDLADAAAKAGTGTNTTTAQILLPAGTIEYAQLITQANTDAPGPVLAQIVSGPLAGARLIGSFQALDSYLVISFSTIVIKGISYSASAVAIDPDTANPGLVSDIDHRYLERVILPAAAAFAEGLGSAVADYGNSTVVATNDVALQSTTKLNTKQQVYKGVEQGASKLGDILDQQAQSTKPLITVNAGTAMGIFFTTPVVKDTSSSGQTQTVVNNSR